MDAEDEEEERKEEEEGKEGERVRGTDVANDEEMQID